MRLSMLADSQKVGGIDTDADDDQGRPNMTSNKLTENDKLYLYHGLSACMWR